MTREPGQDNAAAPDIGTKLAFERTFLAHERTQMAWLRTALSLISFGFAVSKFVEYIHQKNPEGAGLLGPRGGGILMISIGLAALVLAAIQHARAMKLLRAQDPDLPVSVAQMTSGLVGILGILSLVGALIRQRF